MDYNKIDLCYCKLGLNSEMHFSATQLRSYLGYRFIADSEFHHHDDNPYRYPLIQYKRIKQDMYVLGIMQYAALVQDRISGLQHITIKNNDIPITNITFENTTHVISDQITKYRFTSPWIALNQQNYQKMQQLPDTFQIKFLEKILTGNLLSTLKGLDCQINHELYVKINWIRQVPAIVHHHDFSGFYGEFIANISLPKFIGLGKSVSKGFGIIEIIS